MPGMRNGMAKPKEKPVKKMRGGGMAATPPPDGMKRGGGVGRGGRPKRSPKPKKIPHSLTPPPPAPGGGSQSAPDGLKKRPKPVSPPFGMKDGGDATKAKKKAKPKKKVSSGSRVRSSSSKPL